MLRDKQNFPTFISFRNKHIINRDKIDIMLNDEKRRPPTPHPGNKYLHLISKYFVQKEEIY